MTIPHVPFNGDKYIGEELRRLIAHFGIRSAVESGMWSAHTTRELRTMVPGKVSSIDVTTEHLLAECGPDALADLAALGIDFVLGNSNAMLAEVLRGYGEKDHPVLAYLDGHGPDCPILEELDALAADPRCRDRVVLAIHDCIVPNKDFGYNWVQWSWTNGPQPLGYEVLKYKFPAIWPGGYEYFFNEQAEGCQRGVLYCVPKQGEGHAAYLSAR